MILNKTCKICGEDKTSTEYYKHKLTKDRLEPRCKACMRAGNRKRKYGLTEDTFKDLWVEAANKCAICAETLTLERYGYAVDHNHHTGEVRGLLCSSCNKALGLFKDNPTILRAATAYLEVRGHYGGA